MSDLIRLDHGEPPWRPTPDAEVVKQYRYYDIPLCGVVRQGACEYVFEQIDEGEDDVGWPSLWLYFPVTAPERAYLEESSETFAERFSTLRLHGWGCLALATDRLGIVDVEDSELTREAITQAVAKMSERLGQMSERVKQMNMLTH